MIDRLLIHSVTVVRPGHTITGRKKTLSESTVATGVRCRLEPAADVESVSVLGVGAAESWRGFFAAGADLQNRDELTWTDRTPNQVFTVEGILDFAAMDGSREHHLEASLKRKKVG